MPSEKELQDECKAAGINCEGKVADLIQRLQDYRNQELSSSPSHANLRKEEMLVTQSTVGDAEIMEREVQAGSKIPRDKNTQDLPMVGGDILGGHSRSQGLAGLAERIRILEARSVLKDQRLSMLKERDLMLDQEISLLQDTVSTLKLAGEAYRQVRQRFVSTFIRDKLGCAKQSDHDLINEVHGLAHGGDAVVDALLYEGIGAREDTYAFEDLYGIHPSDIKRIWDPETIEILNLHATVRASKEKTGTDQFYKKFAEFIRELKWSSFNSNYLLADPTDRVHIAYLSLRKCQIYQESA
ncbi:unnamed protein product [Tuber aestivum]|uniref:SAP domain-containing protein n=1 Tax=Tuber aestivum TaxID=59557 RepID=A0A292PNA6_9PEZI|nr:unnamed protein product [Tuber aestivum]